MVFGGVDSSHHDGDHVFTPVTRADFWQLRMDNVTVYGQTGGRNGSCLYCAPLSPLSPARYSAACCALCSGMRVCTALQDLCFMRGVSHCEIHSLCFSSCTCSAGPALGIISLGQGMPICTFVHPHHSLPTPPLSLPPPFPLLPPSSLLRTMPI